MPIYYGSNKIKKLYYGSNKIGKVYYGSTKVYDEEVDDVINLGTPTLSTSTPGYSSYVYDNTAVVKLIGGNKLSISGSGCTHGDKFDYDHYFPYTCKTNINVGKQTKEIKFHTYMGSGTNKSIGYLRMDYRSVGKVDKDGYLYLPTSAVQYGNTEFSFDNFGVTGSVTTSSSYGTEGDTVSATTSVSGPLIITLSPQ